MPKYIKYKVHLCMDAHKCLEIQTEIRTHLHNNHQNDKKVQPGPYVCCYFNKFNSFVLNRELTYISTS